MESKEVYFGLFKYAFFWSEEQGIVGTYLEEFFGDEAMSFGSSFVIVCKDSKIVHVIITFIWIFVCDWSEEMDSHAGETGWGIT